MINRNDQRGMKPSFVPKYSDPDVVKSILKSDLWQYIVLRDKKAFWVILKAGISLKIEMFAMPLKTVFRCAHGKRTMGIFITVMSALMMIGFNTKHIAGYLATFCPFAAPALPFLMSGDQLMTLTFVDVRSVYLTWFWMVYLVLSSVHLGCIYTGFGATKTASTKRGTSLLYRFLFKHMSVSETVVQRFIEPILAVGTGYVFCYADFDLAFGIFLMIAGFCVFVQEIYDAVLRYVMEQ